MAKKALVTFANGETLELHEYQLIIPIVKTEFKDGPGVSQGEPYELWSHTHQYLIPAIATLLSTCEFFQLIDDDSKIYSSSAVVTVKNL